MNDSDEIEGVPDVTPFGRQVLLHIEREAKIGSIHVPDQSQSIARARVVRVGPQCEWARVGDRVLPHPGAALLHVPGTSSYVLVHEGSGEQAPYGLLARDDRPHVKSARVDVAHVVPPQRRGKPRGEFQ